METVSTNIRTFCCATSVDVNSPSTPSRDDLGPNQVCTLFGATPGDSSVSGPAYVSAGYGLSVSDQWKRNFLVLVGFLILFQITQILLIELRPVSHRDCFAWMTEGD